MARHHTALVAKELQNLSIDIAALSEMRLPDVGDRKEAKNSFFWSSVSSHSERSGTSGTGFAMSNEIVKNLAEHPRAVTDRIMTLRIAHTSPPLFIGSAYAPTLVSSDDEKSQFYIEL